MLEFMKTLAPMEGVAHRIRGQNWLLMGVAYRYVQWLSSCIKHKT